MLGLALAAQITVLVLLHLIPWTAALCAYVVHAVSYYIWSFVQKSSSSCVNTPAVGCLRGAALQQGFPLQRQGEASALGWELPCQTRKMKIDLA